MLAVTDTLPPFQIQAQLDQWLIPATGLSHGYLCMFVTQFISNRQVITAAYPNLGIQLDPTVPTSWRNRPTTYTLLRNALGVYQDADITLLPGNLAILVPGAANTTPDTLTDAICAHCEPCVRFLLKAYPCSTSLYNRCGWSLLYVSLLYSTDVITSLLIEQAQSIGCRHFFRGCVIHPAAPNFEGSPIIVEVVRERNDNALFEIVQLIPPTAGNTALASLVQTLGSPMICYQICSFANVNTARSLLDRGVDIANQATLSTGVGDGRARTCWHAAVANPFGNSILRFMDANSFARRRTADNQGETPLMLALQMGYDDSAQWLLTRPQHGAEMMTHAGHDALHYALEASGPSCLTNLPRLTQLLMVGVTFDSLYRRIETALFAFERHRLAIPACRIQITTQPRTFSAGITQAIYRQYKAALVRELAEKIYHLTQQLNSAQNSQWLRSEQYHNLESLAVQLGYGIKPLIGISLIPRTGLRLLSQRAR